MDHSRARAEQARASRGLAPYHALCYSRRMPQAPLFAYLGFEDGQLRLYVSPQALNPWGSRVVKGRSPPAVVTRFLDDGQEPIGALKAAARYFAGQEFGLDTPEFGDLVPAARKRRLKKPLPDTKVVQ